LNPQQQFINPIPCIPFPLLRGRGRYIKRGGASLLLNFSNFWGVQEGLRPSSENFPLFLEGEGDNGGEGVSDWAKKP